MGDQNIFVVQMKETKDETQVKYPENKLCVVLQTKVSIYYLLYFTLGICKYKS